MATKKSVIYKHTVKPDKENEFLKTYRQLAQYFLKNGARNFAINKNADGDYLIYQVWENSANPHWSESDNLPNEVKNLIKTLKGCYTPDTRKDRSKPMTMVEKIYEA